jgi:neutral ceramidase
VISRLTAEFGDVYRFENVLISATHTHSGPAGFLQYVLFSVTSMGFIEQTFQAMVAGIVEVTRMMMV